MNVPGVPGGGADLKLRFRRHWSVVTGTFGPCSLFVLRFRLPGEARGYRGEVGCPETGVAARTVAGPSFAEASGRKPGGPSRAGSR